MPDSLRSKTLHALSWSFMESMGLQVMSLVIGIIMARILYPEQFGLVGMLTIFMAVAQTFQDGGFGVALVQKKDATQVDACSIFYFNIFVALAAAGILCLAAPWIADFYGQPILTPLMRVLSLNIVFNSFSTVHTAILTKKINFKTQTKANISGSILSGILGITLAVLGFGVWSLVVMQITGTLISTAFLWLYSPWRPSMIFSISSLKTMFGFGSRMMVSGLMNQIFYNVYSVVIGKLFSATDLGLFTRARNLQELPSKTTSSMVGRVAFTVFSSVQDDPDRLKRGMKKALITLVMVTSPIMIGLSVIAKPLVLVLLTEKWAACIPYLQLLCMAGLADPIHLTNMITLQATGRADLALRLETIKNILILVNVFVCWHWGIMGLIYGMVAMSVICCYLYSYYSGMLVGYPIQEQLRDVYVYLIAAMLMGILVYAVGLLPFPNNWIMLIVQIAVGMVMYITTCRLCRLEAFMDLWQECRTRMGFIR